MWTCSRVRMMAIVATVVHYLIFLIVTNNDLKMKVELYLSF